MNKQQRDELRQEARKAFEVWAKANASKIHIDAIDEAMGFAAGWNAALDAYDCVPREVAERLAERLRLLSKNHHQRRRHRKLYNIEWSGCPDPICTGVREALAALERQLGGE